MLTVLESVLWPLNFWDGMAFELFLTFVYNIQINHFSRWHGCRQCYNDTARDMKIGGRTIEELYQATMQRINDLQAVHGYEVHVKWECEFREELKRDPELKAEFEDIFITTALDHRVHTLRGGRTEPFAFKHQCDLDDEEIYLLDIVSPHFYLSLSLFLRYFLT